MGVDKDQLVSTDEQQKAPGILGPKALAGVKVLVVDDIADMRLLVYCTLRKYGAIVEQAASVDAGVRAIESFNPDVIISDIGMPEKTGYDLIRILRTDLEAHGKEKTPAIALSGFGDDNTQRTALKEGFQVAMSKPFKKERLALLVQALAILDGDAVRNGFDSASVR